MKMDDKRLAVIGLGLMGGSFARALRRWCPEIIGADVDPAVLKMAERLGVVDRATFDLSEALEVCDFAVLAVPVRASISLLQRMGHDLPAPPLLMDLGSTKREVVRAMQDLPAGCDPIGGHPMCGKETSGLASSDPALFENAIFVLTPLERTSREMQGFAVDLVEGLGAIPLSLDPERHDRLVALSSHLPYLLAMALMASSSKLGERDEALWDLIGPGFRDATRLAASDVTMMLDILLTNRQNVASGLHQAQESLQLLASLIEEGHAKELADFLASIRSRRASLGSRPVRSQD